MRDPIEQYLDEVMWNAALARPDEKTVRQELKEHLCTLADSNNPPTEVYTMLEETFGSARLIGDAIARARGRFRTWLKKQARRLPITLAIALVLAFAVRWRVAEAFYAAGNAAAPAVPQGSRVLVYKLATNFSAGDVVVFRSDKGLAYLGTVKRVQADGSLLLSRNGSPDQIEPRDCIVGRVFLNTR
jgi:Signal peptidase, peptidase S26